MGIGFDVTGRCRAASRDAESWLDGVRSWLEEHAGEPMESVRPGRDEQEHPAVLVNLHPCAEEVEITVRERGRIGVRAKTSTVGPGYHAHLCGLLHRLGEAMAIDWDGPADGPDTGDETGFFYTGDQRALEDEFLHWLSGVAKLIVEGLEQEYQWMMMSMVLGHHYRHHGPLVTPMGPRDRSWLEAAVEDPVRGIDLFPWWPAGVGAPFYLGRALARMWQEVRWRAPLTEDEGRLLMDVHLDLARAHRLDPTLAYPWREWLEVMEYIEEHFGYVEAIGDAIEIEAEVRRRASASVRKPPESLIGYRRRPVRVELTDEWSIEIPGEMIEEWDDEGLWTARDDARVVCFKSYSLTTDDGRRPAPREILEGLQVPDGRRFSHRNEGMVGQAVLAPPGGEDAAGWQLIGHNAIEGGLAACNIIFRDPDESDWAIATWRSLEHS